MICLFIKKKSAFQKVHKKRSLSQDMQLESLVNLNTGQMSRASICSPEPQLYSDFRKVGSNSRSVSLPRKNLAGRKESLGGKSETFPAVPPGFECPPPLSPHRLRRGTRQTPHSLTRMYLQGRIVESGWSIIPLLRSTMHHR